ncbi:FAD-dependent oxidoreductase [Archangium sp.]|uniref:FAD-dependent oxidoreductase n=1 Tax=Archangium sp. TaxID=1872627 RepID=UPI00389A9A59
MRSIGVADVIRHMQVPEEPGLYVLGCFERRVTLRSQQVRALNLVHALRETGRIRQDSHVAVIGGGAAGMTLAAAAARLGCAVTLLEKQAQLLPLFRGNHTRWLHPHIYDWPEDESLSDEAGLPLLSWRAALAGEVARQLDAEWDRLPERSRLRVVCGVRSVDLPPAKGTPRRVAWNTASAYVPDEFDAVVLAVGFGLEREVEGIEWLSYWDDDRLHQPHRRGGKLRYLISGCGDGGLVDLLRVKLSDFRHEKLVEELLSAPGLDTVKQELLSIEQEALARRARGEGSSEFLEKRYRKLQVPAGVDSALEKRLRADTEAVLNGLEASPLTLDASILNRFLVSRLLSQPWGVGYRAGEFKHIRAGEQYQVTFNTGEPELFDHVVCRHGPRPGALETGFRGVWEKCGPLRSRSELDQTRWPIWPEGYFDAPGSPEASPPAPAGTPPEAKPTAGEPFIGVPSESLGEGFKGRAEDLERLHKSLRGSGGVVLTGVWAGRVFAHGSGGIGKSRLAIEYAWRHRQDYPGGVFFVVAEEHAPGAIWAQLARQFFPDASELQDEEAALRFAKWLAEPKPGRRLLVLDDIQARAPEELMTRFDRQIQRGVVLWPPPPEHVSLLITTRMREFPGAQGLEIKQLEDTAALELLTDKAGRLTLTHDELPVARDIAVRILGGHPLALSLAGAYVRRLGLSFAEYRDAVSRKGLTDRLEAAAKEVGYTVRDHERSIVATYELSRRQLDLDMPVDALAWRSLRMAAFLAPNVPIDRKLLQRLLKRESLDVDVDMEELGRALARLEKDLSLLDPVRDEQGCTSDVRIHPLVADYTRWSMMESEREQVQRLLIEAIARLFPAHPGDFPLVLGKDPHPQWERLTGERASHADELWRTTHGLRTYGRYKLGLGLGDLYFSRGSLRDASRFYQAVVDFAAAWTDKVPDGVSPQRDASVGLNRLGDVLRQQGALDEAWKVYAQSLAIAEELAPKEPQNIMRQRDVWVGQTKLGDVLKDKEDWVEARKAYERSLSTARELVRKQPGSPLRQRDLSVSLENLGDVLKAQGELDTALKTYQESLSILDALLQADPGNVDWLRDVSICLEKLGHFLNAQGDLDAALNAFKRSLAISEDAANREPDYIMWWYDVSIGQLNVGRVLMARREWGEARKALETSLKLAEELTSKDPEHLEWRKTLIEASVEFAELLLPGTPDERSRARALLERAKHMLKQLAATSRLTSEQRNQLLPRIDQLLSQLNPPPTTSG